MGANPAGKFQTVFARHHHVDDRGMIRFADFLSCHQLGPGIGRTGRRRDFCAGTLEIILEDIAIGFSVVDDKNAGVCQHIKIAINHASCGRTMLKRQFKGDQGPFAELAFERDRSAHQFDEVAGNREPKARSTEAPVNGRLRLSEGLKQFFSHAFFDADAGISNFESNARLHIRS